MRRLSSLLSAIVLAMLMGSLALPSPAQAQASMGTPANRAGTWEFQLPISYTESWTVDGEGGSRAEVNSDFGMGIGFGYNFNDHFQLSGLFGWKSRSYDATIANTDGTTQRAAGTLNSSTLALNATYFFMPTGLTPYVSAGIGSTFMDSNIPTGQGSTACWWDPWWGYICNTYTPTLTETALSYTAGLGVRWDLTPVISLQAGYNRMWIDASKSTPEFDSWVLGFVFRM
jgi:opacity protein-like surface antigen